MRFFGTKTNLFIIFFTAFFVFSASGVWGAGFVKQREELGIPLNDIKMIDQNTAIAVGYSGRIIRTTNAGATWSSIAPSGYGSATFHALDTVGSRIFVVGGGNTMLRSTDSGATWSSMAPVVAAPASTHYYGVDFVSFSFGWAVGEIGGTATVFSTTDGGATWDDGTARLPSGISRLRDIACTGLTTCYAVGSDGVIVKTTNGGNTWNNLTSGTAFNLYGIRLIDSNRVWAVGDVGQVLTTTNGGTTWNRTTVNAGVTYFDTDARNIDSGFVVGNLGNVSRTINATASPPVWASVALPNSEQSQLLGVSIISMEQGYAVGEGGRIYRYDGIAPTVGALTSDSATAGQEVTLSSSFSDNLGIRNCELADRTGLAEDDPSAVLGQMNAFEGERSGSADIAYTFAAAGTYSLRAECEDQTGNRGLGTLTTVTVSAAPDTEPPAAPANTRITSVSTDTTPSFAWDAAVDNVGVTAYRAAITTSAGASLGLHFVLGIVTTFTLPDGNALASGMYSLEVWGSDAAGNAGTRSQIFFTVESAPADGGGGASDGGGGADSGVAAPLATEPSTPPGLLPAGFQIGDLVKLADDGNPNTFGDSSVFYLGADGARYVFTNDKAYFTWYSDFSGVRTISTADLASVPLRGNVTYRPGIKMVKLQTNPTVYVVERGGVLRAVPSEDVAKTLYGVNWNQRIDDINDAFWNNYRRGAPLPGAADYNPIDARDGSGTISIDKGLVGDGVAVP